MTACAIVAPITHQFEVGLARQQRMQHRDGSALQRREPRGLRADGHDHIRRRVRAVIQAARAIRQGRDVHLDGLSGQLGECLAQAAGDFLVFRLFFGEQYQNVLLGRDAGGRHQGPNRSRMAFSRGRGNTHGRRRTAFLVT